MVDANTWELKDYGPRLLSIIGEPGFCDMSRPENDLPFYICPYEPSRHFGLQSVIKVLCDDLSAKGLSVLHLNIYDLVLELLEERSILAPILEGESDMDKGELKEMMQNVVSPEAHLVPKIMQKRQEIKHALVFISGVGEAFPYMRTHNLLNNLHSQIKDVPTVIFFPGSYNFGLGHGATLELFSTLTDDQYYRARNIKDLWGGGR